MIQGPSIGAMEKKLYHLHSPPRLSEPRSTLGWELPPRSVDKKPFKIKSLKN